MNSKFKQHLELFFVNNLISTYNYQLYEYKTYLLIEKIITWNETPSTLFLIWFHPFNAQVKSTSQLCIPSHAISRHTRTCLYASPSLTLLRDQVCVQQTTTIESKFRFVFNYGWQNASQIHWIAKHPFSLRRFSFLNFRHFQNVYCLSFCVSFQ